MKIIKILCAIALLLLVPLVAFPESKYHFAYLSGLFGSVAGFLAVEKSYRTQEYVSTRGGIVEKSKSPVQYAAPYVIMGIFFIGIIFSCTLGSFGMMG